jgi:hypothetical integral membrane protein (TIGR02206 family)
LIIIQGSIILGRVQLLSLEHLLPILLAVGMFLLLILYGKRSSIKTQSRLMHGIALAVSLTVIAFHLHKMLTSYYDLSKDLPLYLCSLLALLIPIYTYFRKYWMFEILVFWIIAGTLQAVITPDISEGFPSFDYFRYWIVHLGLLTIILYSIFVLKLKPKFTSVFKSFFALQGYVILMVIINYFLDANYFYLNEKPKSASLLDYFGDWPYYLIVTQLIVFPLFLIIYLPFKLSEVKKGKLI